MSKTKKSKTFIKIIYFDEGSATDLLYILGGGKSTDKEEKIVTKTTQLAAGAEAQAGAKINLLTKITAGMGIDGSADASREGRSILSKAIESTVLTDYIRCTENEAKSHITVFTKCKPYAFPGSFTYFKMLTPFLTMTDGKVEVAKGLNFNLALMDQALGKTETAKYIAEKLNERLFRKQFSMLHSEEFTSYLFGGKHNQNSFAKELLERESNVILLDEFDKPNPVFYSAFYQLFDEGVFADKNYTVTMKNAIIICTSNFLSEEQIRERLGDPIYSRFDAVIHFTDLQPEAVQKLLDREIDRQYSKLDEEERAIIDSRKIVSLLKTNSYCLSNARQIKKFVREAFSATITDEVL